MTYRVVCPHCKKEVLESNEKIDGWLNGSSVPNGTMFSAIPGLKVRQPHRQWAGIKGQNFPCPMCMRPLADMRGNLILREIVVPAPEPELQVVVPPAPKPEPKVKKTRKRRQKKGS